MIIGWARADHAVRGSLPAIVEGTVYDSEKQRAVGSITINKSETNYGITAYNFITSSWKVGKSNIEQGLVTAKEKAEAIFRELIPQLS